MKVLLILLMLFSFGFAQEAQLDKDVIDIDVLAGLSTVNFNGDFKVFESPIAIGLQYKGIDPDVSLGFYFMPVFQIGGEEKSSLSLMLYTSVYKKFGMGIGWRFIQGGAGYEDKGFIKPNKETVFLSFNFSLLGGE